jgi:hypothetical protein
VADALFGAPLRWPLHHASLPDGTELAALPDSRAILEIPPSTSATPPPGQWRDIGAILQVQHGHPTGGSPMGLCPRDGAGASTNLSRTSQEAKRGVEHLTKTGSLRTRDLRALQTAMDDGFGWVVFYPAYRHIPPDGAQTLARCLGTPRVMDSKAWIFPLPREIPLSCLATDG